MKSEGGTDWKGMLSHLVRFLEDVVGPRVLAIRESGTLGTEEKRGFTDIKTLGDTVAECLIMNFLRAHFPSWGIRGEEGTNEQGDAGRECIVDPIDGTTVYASGMPQFGISVGFAENGVPVAGVIHYPALKLTAWAVQGLGAFNGTRIVPLPYGGAQNEKVISADLALGTEFLFGPLHQRFASVLALGAHVYAALLVAQGSLKAYVSTGATPYDMCAAIVLVRESGGVAIGIDSDEIDLSLAKSRVIYARTRELAEEIREVIRSAEAEQEGVAR
jgi:fructose-1,6-bisphosphatase/inositol monophosphatase family enzyme